MALKTWTGASSTTWSTAGNWSPSGAPGIGDDALFSSNFSSVNITTGTPSCKSLTVTGTGVQLTGTGTLNIYGNITLNSATTVSATGTWSILNTAGQTTYDIVSAGVTFNCNLTLNAGTASTYRLVQAAGSPNGNFTMSSLRTLTLTTGILNLNGYNLSVGLFSSNNSNSRSIAFSSDQSNSFDLTGVGTVFSLNTVTGWSYTGYSNFRVTNATATAKTVTTTGMSTYPANFYFTGAGTVTLTSGNYFLILDASALAGTLSKSSASTMVIGASLLFTSGTSSVGGSGVTTFNLVSGLGGSLATGTLDLGGRNWGAMTFSSGAWKTEGFVGSPAAAEAVICSAGSLLIQWDFYCETFTVTGSGNVQLGFQNDAYLTCTETSTSAAAFTVSSGIFEMTAYGGVFCNVATISGGRLTLDINGYTLDCLRMNITGAATWNGVDPFNYIDYFRFDNNTPHIKHRSVVSNWNSASFTQSRYQSSSTQIIVMFTTFDASSSTLRNISDSSGMFAFCWDTHITATQRFGIASGSVIGGLDLTNINVSTFEGGYNFTCNGSYIDLGHTCRTLGGTITLTGGTSTKPYYFAPYEPLNFPFSVTFGSNGYFVIPGGSSLTSPRSDSSFRMSGCTIESLADTGGLLGVYITFAVIDLNFSGVNTFIGDTSDGATYFTSTATSGIVINAQGANLTLKGAPDFSLSAYSGLGRTVKLPESSNYFYSSSTSRAASFTDDGLTDTLTISGNPLLTTVSLSNSTVNFANMTVQSRAVIYSPSCNGTSLTIWGILHIIYYGSTSRFQIGNSITDVYIGSSSINNTDLSIEFIGEGTSNIGNLTLNSGRLEFRPQGGDLSATLPNLTINSINTATPTTLAVLDYSYYPNSKVYIQNLTVANTSTINFTDDTVLISDPRNAGLNRTWELAGKTVPKVVVSNNSRLNIMDANNSGTTYIKEVSGQTAVLIAPPSITFGSQSILVAGGTVSHNYNSTTRVLTFSLYGGGSTRNNQSVILNYTITPAEGTNVNYTINWTVSSESGYDKGYVTIAGNYAIDGVSGSNSGSASGTISVSGTSPINLAYNKDISATGGTDTFSGSITFTAVPNIPPSYLSFQAGRTFTFDKFFRDPAPHMLYLTSDTSGSQTNLVIPERNLGTLVQGTNPGGVYTATIRDCVVTSTNYMWFAGNNSVDAGNNSGWIFGASPTTQTNIQFFL